MSGYRKGASVPEGQTRFEFRAGDLDFRSSAYQWLVVSGPKAQFKGSGTVNGPGGFGFLLTANDAARPGGGGVDRFRIKIWNTLTGSVVYDNQAGEADTAPAGTEVGGGAIVIHDKGEGTGSPRPITAGWALTTDPHEGMRGPRCGLGGARRESSPGSGRHARSCRQFAGYP